MMLAISEYVHDYSGCGDKDLFLGRSESNFFLPLRSVGVAPPPSRSLLILISGWRKDTCSLRVPLFNSSAKSKMTLSTKDIHKSCHKLSSRIVCFDFSHFDNTDNEARTSTPYNIVSITLTNRTMYRR